MKQPALPRFDQHGFPKMTQSQKQLVINYYVTPSHLFIITKKSRMLSFKPIPNNKDDYLTYQIKPDYNILPTSLSPYQIQGMACIPFSQKLFPNADILVTFLLRTFSLLATMSGSFPLCLPIPPSYMAQSGQIHFGLSLISLPLTVLSHISTVNSLFYYT